MTDTDILLATTNPAKQRALLRLLEGLPLRPVTPQEVGLAGFSVSEEEGSSHKEIARLKSEEWSKAGGGMMAISSDGGLVIPALGPRWESLFTHRFAGEDADDHTRLERLLGLMRPYKAEARRASWVEALAIAEGGRTLASWQVDGASGLLLEGLGSRPLVPGFWVFSLWYFSHLGKTYNDLSEQELAGLNDHWVQLGSLVRGYFLSAAP